jgi:hypothetical protein
MATSRKERKGLGRTLRASASVTRHQRYNPEVFTAFGPASGAPQ